MTTLREAAQQALEALEWFNKYGSEEHGPSLRGAECSLRAALAEPVQEPFGYLWPTGRHPEFRFTQQKRDGVDGMPLYTAPPQRKPLTLTDLQEALVYTNLIDRDAIEDPDGYDEGSTLAQIDELHRAIERAHGIGEKE